MFRFIYLLAFGYVCLMCIPISSIRYKNTPDGHSVQRYQMQYIQSYEIPLSKIDNIPDLLYREFISRGLSDYEANTLIRLAQLESGFNINAVGINVNICGRIESAKGLFQIMPCTWEDRKCAGDIFNVFDQINCAIKIYKTYGFNAWDTY